MSVQVFGKYFFLCILGIFIYSCEKSGNTELLNTTQPYTELQVGILPDQSKDQLLGLYTALFDKIEKDTGLQFNLLIPSSYEELVEWFADGKVDIGYFGGVTFLQAHQRAGAIPLVMRDVDRHFTSYLITHHDSGFKSLEDLKNASFTFGSRFSTSGHIMPRYFFHKSGVQPEQYFSDVRYSEAHDKTLDLVRSKDIQAGVINGTFFDISTSNDPTIENDINIIWQSPTYPDYVWAIQAHFSRTLQNQLIDSFLSLSMIREKDKALLMTLGAKAFYPAQLEDFSTLKHAMELDKLDYIP